MDVHVYFGEFSDIYDQLIPENDRIGQSFLIECMTYPEIYSANPARNNIIIKVYLGKIQSYFR